MRWGWIVVCVLACGDDGPAKLVNDVLPLPDAWFGPCNPIAQQGCAEGQKCTWVTDPDNNRGEMKCTTAGPALLRELCSYTMDGTDTCGAGLFCSPQDQRCRSICSLTGTSGCDANHRCDDHRLFKNPGDVSTIGLCERPCDPLEDNDFDGGGTTLSKVGTACGSDPAMGCGGYPHSELPPTQFTCFEEINHPSRFEHRVPAPPGSLRTGSCSQGYLPLLFESTGNSTVVCVAMCKPMNCYSGNCGTNDEGRLGAAPHRCNDTDRRGTFDNSPSGEHCTYLWWFEIDQSTKLHLPSDFSDSVGFCWNHSKYLYDSNNDNARDAPYPACSALQDGWGAGTNPGDPLTYWGAADLGCVDSSRLPVMATGKPRALDIRPLFDRHSVDLHVR